MLEIAVFSDIHSNYEAFKACFEYCSTRGIDRYLFLGDYVSDCPEPEKTMELIYIIRDYFKARFIKGNREEYLLDHRDRGETGWHDGSASGSLLYTYEHLTERDLYFFEKMPICDVWEEPGYPPIQMCHGTPSKAGGFMFKGERNTRRIMNSLKTDVLLHGHNHVQESYLVKNKLSLNPGSIGVPWGHGGKAQFAILRSDSHAWTGELVELDYDREAEIKSFTDSGLVSRAPAWAALTMHTLRTGTDLSQAVLLRASVLCKEERGDAVWPHIPEKYWAQALMEYRIDLLGRAI